MSLLPKSSAEFASTTYWDNFFKKRGNQAFDWYGEYPEVLHISTRQAIDNLSPFSIFQLCDQLHKYIKAKDDTLMVGCGNSALSETLHDVGYTSLTNIDISSQAIKQMAQKRPEMKWMCMDATAMTFGDETFSVVLDKGTLDALLPDETALETAKKYFDEINRVLKTAGRYICITLLQSHILKALLDYFPQQNFMFRIVRCFAAEQKTLETSSTAMPVFVVVATKFKKLPLKMLEVCMGGDKMERLTSEAEMIEAVTQTQTAAMVCNGLARGSIAKTNEVSLDLFIPGEKKPRYTLNILDQAPVRGNNKFAAFIVPQGRETEWLFSTPQGRKKLLASAQHNRLAIVTMHRDQLYKTWEDVKAELVESIKNLAPAGMTDQIPYLSLGADIGKREVIFKGNSKLSGDYIVDEIIGHDDEILRRLIFLSSSFVIQSEAAIKVVKSKKGEVKKIVDLGYLACQHHLFMTVGVDLSIAQKQAPTNDGDVLIIGLGGGGLCMFVHQIMPKVRITVVEIDPAIYNVATEYFGLTTGDNLQVAIRDGVLYLEEAATEKKHYDAILFDVDSKDVTLGMSCPPKIFLQPSCLASVKQCIGERGVFILNLVTRDDALRETVLADLRAVFPSICSYKLDEDVNEILFCTNSALETATWRSAVEKSAKKINKFSKSHRMRDTIDVEDFLRDLKL
jgi:spermidine synthase